MMMAAIQKLPNNFTEAEVDDEIIIMRLDNGEILSLVDSAAAAWRLIDGRRDREALIGSLAAEYAADQQEITRDISGLLQQLAEAGLIAEG
jgi:hypothetical protein